MKKIIAIFSLLLISACTYPQTNTSTVNDEPTLVFEGASKTAIVYLNDLEVGLANKYNGDPNTLIIPRGTHMLEIKDNGATLFSKKIFVSDGASKTITLSGKKE